MNVFVARQPIFDKLKRVVAYELLFRSGFETSSQRTTAMQHRKLS
jgi:c-di-GMP-related signal transduction protein